MRDSICEVATSMIRTLPMGDPQVARKRWIGAMKPRGELRLDAGAVVALTQGKSLLPAGVTTVTGGFGRGGHGRGHMDGDDASATTDS